MKTTTFLATGLATLVFGATAFAQDGAYYPEAGRTRIDNRWGQENRWNGRDDNRDFERGLNDGRRDGYNDGKRDGEREVRNPNGGNYSLRSRRDDRTPYSQGYARGYEEGYNRGFDEMISRAIRQFEERGFRDGTQCGERDGRIATSWNQRDDMLRRAPRQFTNLRNKLQRAYEDNFVRGYYAGFDRNFRGSRDNSSNRDFDRGFREGFRLGFTDGQQAARAGRGRNEANRAISGKSRQNDYERGYVDGYTQGFDRGYSSVARY